MNQPFTYFERFDDVAAIPEDSILSRTLLDTPEVKLVLFHFAAGQALSEHTASMPAIIQIVSGEARLLLGDEERAAQPGAWVYMPAHLKHGVYATTPVIMVLQLIKSPKTT